MSKSDFQVFMLRVFGGIPRGRSGVTVREAWNTHFEENNIYILLNFIDAHEESVRKLEEVFSKEDSHSLVAEQQMLIKNVLLNVNEAKIILARTDVNVLKAVSTRQAAQFLLNKQNAYISHLVEDGLLKPTDADEFFNIVREDISLLRQDISIG